MAVMKPQPRTRQRALLAEWGIDERYVPEYGIDDEGVVVLLEASPNGWEIRSVSYQSGELIRTTLAYPTREHHDRMMKARQDDWDEHVASFGVPALDVREISNIHSIHG